MKDTVKGKSFARMVEILKSHPESQIVERLAVPLEVGCLFPIEQIESLLMVHDFNYSLNKIGGVIFKHYILTIREVTVGKLLEFLYEVKSLIEGRA